MPKIPMRPIAEPAANTRTIMKSADPIVFIRGGGDYTYTCANCGKPMMENVEEQQGSNIVFCCPDCGTYNEKF